MSSVHSTVDTVNAAATAIIAAETRVQPTTVRKRRWGSCWSLYWCFGSYKHSKRIGHAVLVPEPTTAAAGAEAVPVTQNLNSSTAIVLPFIAPPSSPASFLQSDPPSATQSPAGLLSLTSLSVNAYSPGGAASIFAIGPYAHEIQLVSPPVFSTFTTEPSTASFTPPPEPVQFTTPSSPEVPFAQLLTSSLSRPQRTNGAGQKLLLSQYDFQPYQYPGSPGGHLISPGSAVSNSGTSSPFPGKCPVVEFRMGEAPKFLGYEHFSSLKWGSRFSSGSLTPNGWGSRLGSGSLTPIDKEPPSRDNFLLESQISEVASLANSDSGSHDEIVDHRVSFELPGEDVPRCLEKDSTLSCKYASESMKEEDIAAAAATKGIADKDLLHEELSNDKRSKIVGERENEHCNQRHRSISMGSTKEFNFDNSKKEDVTGGGDGNGKPSNGTEWWTKKDVLGKELGHQNNWTFFPMLQSGVS